MLPAYYISYGAHGPRAPIVPPNTNGKVFLGVVGSIITAVGVFALVRMNCGCLIYLMMVSLCRYIMMVPLLGEKPSSLICLLLHASSAQETPKTMSKEWKDAQTEMAREQKMDP